MGTAAPLPGGQTTPAPLPLGPTEQEVAAHGPPGLQDQGGHFSQRVPSFQGLPEAQGRGVPFKVRSRLMAESWARATPARVMPVVLDVIP
jgi:hypothetical protein